MEGKDEKLLARKRSFTFGAYGGTNKFISASESSQPESTQHHIHETLDSPSSETKPFTSTNPSQKVTELFEIIEKLQGSRLEEQRCEFPPPLKSPLLNIRGDLPLILSPKSGGYWIDPPLERNMETSPTAPLAADDPDSYDIMERDREAKIYQEFFRRRYHQSFTAVDPSVGPLVLSVCLEEEDNRFRVILRTNECSLHGTFSTSLFQHLPTAVELAKMLCAGVTVSSFEVVSYLKAPELITAFDQHRVSHTFKFGVLYQREGQLTEEEILSNSEESEEFKDFLCILGQTVKLRGFTGFRGGLDVSYGQTGSEAVFTSFHGREIMFHVATKLPFTDGDTQQLQRKRHIGNDIVAVVYQEGHAPFICDVISSHFLHCFIAVRKVKQEKGADKTDGRGEGSFQVSVTAREDVPPFGPPLPSPPIFTEGSVLREFLLTKLINAEISCYKAERFSRLELRTRSSLLEALRSELSNRSQCMLGEPTQVVPPPGEGGRALAEGGGGFIENFKRAIRVRSHSFDTLGAVKKTGAPKQKDGDSEPGHRSSAHVLDNTEVKCHTSPQDV
ncbi:rap1 GTPase-activating protein 2 [Electrophorus electricus]|uniref:rap1 GTPase-activating protein 2 n=1 Tax=Electrophorus electricus TaxID=8005 RepID=UPI0015D0945D|nr:rap1 GTPase-activating protein 2 [Electrophorus electricus]